MTSLFLKGEFRIREQAGIETTLVPFLDLLDLAGFYLDSLHVTPLPGPSTQYDVSFTMDVGSSEHLPQDGSSITGFVEFLIHKASLCYQDVKVSYCDTIRIPGSRFDI